MAQNLPNHYFFAYFQSLVVITYTSCTILRQYDRLYSIIFLGLFFAIGTLLSILALEYKANEQLFASIFSFFSTVGSTNSIFITIYYLNKIAIIQKKLKLTSICIFFWIKALAKRSLFVIVGYLFGRNRFQNFSYFEFNSKPVFK